jgi:hypothetical protein
VVAGFGALSAQPIVATGRSKSMPRPASMGNMPPDFGDRYRVAMTPAQTHRLTDNVGTSKSFALQLD